MTDYNKEYKCIKSYPRSPEIGWKFNPHKGWGYTLDWMRENPELVNEYFEEVIDWDALLEEAKRRYPVGTKIKSFRTGNIRTIDCVAYNSKKDKYICSRSPSYEWANIPEEESNPFLYKDGKWAEIIDPLFVTEDGVTAYKGDKLYYLPYGCVKNFTLCNHHGMGCTQTCEACDVNFEGKIFSTKQAAEDWVKKNKPVEKKLSYNTKNYSINDIIHAIADCDNKVSVYNGRDFIQIIELIEKLKYDKT